MKDMKTDEFVLEVEGLSLLSPEHNLILDNITFSLRAGEKMAVIGPNGSGKTSLLQALIREKRPDSGTILLRGQPLNTRSALDCAREIAFLSQSDIPDFRLSVEEYVSLGRLPYFGQYASSDGAHIVAQVIKDMGLTAYKHRLMGEVSGGQRQRAALGRALAQSPSILLLDEPTNHLDPPGRTALLSLVKSKNIAVIAVLHDLTAAEAFADRILVLNEGKQVSDDIPESSLQNQVIFPVFGMHSFRVAHPHEGKMLRVFEVPSGS